MASVTRFPPDRTSVVTGNNGLSASTYEALHLPRLAFIAASGIERFSHVQKQEWRPMQDGKVFFRFWHPFSAPINFPIIFLVTWPTWSAPIHRSLDTSRMLHEATQNMLCIYIRLEHKSSLFLNKIPFQQPLHARNHHYCSRPYSRSTTDRSVMIGYL